MDLRPLEFERFRLDPGERLLRRDGEALELNSRYLDVLHLLLRRQGSLVSKQEFHDEVWQGMAVTDEALTQAIRTLRKTLGDSAARPRYIETVPKHGYRFIAEVQPADGEPARDKTTVGAPDRDDYGWRDFVQVGAAGAIGGGVAGFVGGLLYGFVAAAAPGAGLGAISIVLVIQSLTILVALIGACGVSFGLAAAGFASRPPSWQWTMAGGAVGGLLVGAVVKLLGLDMFSLLFGITPGDMTGAGEGLVLGAAVGLGVWLAQRHGRGRASRAVALAAAAGAIAGVAIPLMGGRLMGGSLDLLTRQVDSSRLSLAQLGRLLGEPDFGLLPQVLTGAVEGALFAGCIAGAIVLARRGFALAP